MVGNVSREPERVKGSGTGHLGTGKDPHAKGQWCCSHAYFKESLDDPAAYPTGNRIFLDAQGSQLLATISKNLRGNPSAYVARWNRDQSFRFHACRFGYGSARAGLSTALGTWGPARKGVSSLGDGGVAQKRSKKNLTQRRKG